MARRLSASTSTPARSVSHCRAILSRAVPDRERAPSMVATAPLLGTIFLAQEASAASNFEFTGYAGVWIYVEGTSRA